MKKIVSFLFDISLLLIFFVAGCSTVRENKPDYSLQPYVDSFIKVMDIEPERAEGFSVRFRSSKPGTRKLGSCKPYLKSIDIDPNFWYNHRVSEIARISVIFHEFSHCVCKQYKHYDDLKEDKWPK